MRRWPRGRSAPSPPRAGGRAGRRLPVRWPERRRRHANLDALNRVGGQPWQLSFSFGRALQAAALKAWAGDPANLSAAQHVFADRAALTGAARRGLLSPSGEGAAADNRRS